MKVLQSTKIPGGSLCGGQQRAQRQLHAPPQQRSRSRHSLCQAAPDPEQPDATGEEALDIPSTKLDWRQFRASLIAAEKKQSMQAEQVDAATTSASGPPSTSRLPSADESGLWAHLISAPETGCLLLSKKSAGDMGFFNNSIILLLQHDNNTGSLGLMLGRKLRKSPQGPFAQVIAMVAGIYIGGPVGIDKILTLHGPPAMEDSLELLEDLYVGSWKGAQARVNNQETGGLPELSIYAGSCGWSRRQLEHEEQTGAWWVVSAAPKCIQDILTGNHSEEEVRAKILGLAGVSEIADD